jgi:hypothetical protein
MAVNQSITKKFTPNFKEVSYLSKNFSDFRQNLIEFAKSYYPNTYTDFNESSPGMMFIEMAAYVGDVMSFYIDNQFKENLLAYAQERKNVIAISQAFGYKPRLSAPSTVEATVLQMVPALGSSDNYDPDPKFFLTIQTNSSFISTTNPSQTFRSIEDVSFSDSTDRTIRVLSRNATTGVPTMYVASKKIKLTASEIKTATFTFGSAQEFTRIQLPDSDVVDVISVVDSDGNTWTEVDFLGQDVVLEERDVSPNRSLTGYLSSNSLTTNSPPPAKIAVFRRKPRRFTTRVNTDLRMELWFGSGDADAQDEVLLANSAQIANSKYDQRVENASIDPVDFLSSDTFGLAPANTTLTVTYAVGGGITSNVPSNTITRVGSVNVLNTSTDYDPSDLLLFNQVVSSVAINNEQPATGGGDLETVEEIRQNALAFFNAQNRVVTDKDYLVRTLSIPSKFGQVAKAFVIRDEQINNVLDQDPSKLTFNSDNDPFNNRTYVEDPVAPNSINIYTLGYNSSKRLTTLNSLVKENLAKYLEQFRLLTDDVNILDAFVVNIGIEFDIVVYRNYNMNDVLARSIDAVKDFFDIDKWQINQPIILNDLRLMIGSVEGVRTVNNVTVNNKYRFKHGKDYQQYRYPIDEAIIDDIIYPSLDPCIFEVRYPDTDIIGNARQ